MYTENYKTLLKEIKDDINKWKDILCSWNERLNTIKMPTLSKAIYYRLNAISVKISMAFFFSKTKNITLKFIWNLKGP